MAEGIIFFQLKICSNRALVQYLSYLFSDRGRTERMVVVVMKTILLMLLLAGLLEPVLLPSSCTMSPLLPNNILT